LIGKKGQGIADWGLGMGDWHQRAASFNGLWPFSSFGQLGVLLHFDFHCHKWHNNFAFVYLFLSQDLVELFRIWLIIALNNFFIRYH